MSDDFDALLDDKTPFAVELNAYALPDDHRVFKCSPGKTYRFYEAVREAEVVFPDVRGLAELGEEPSLWDDEEALKIIAQDRWTRELESRSRGNKHKPGTESVNATDRTSLTFLKRLLFEARKGDMVVIPADGYDKDVLFGEFTTDPGLLTLVEAKDGEYYGSYVGRPVKWRKFTAKRDLRPELIDELHYRAAVFVLSRSRSEDVYREVFGNFVYRGNFVAEFRTEKKRFTPEDHAVVSTWLNGFDYLRHTMEDNPASSLPSQMGFYQMGLEPVPDGEAAELRINIQSPGEIFVRSAGPFALALMAMFALSGCDSKAVVDNGVTIQMKTIGDGAPDCRIQVEEAVNGIVRTMSYKRLDEANCLGTRAQKGALVSTEAQLKSAPNESK